jgi:hypothetical protein
MYAFCLTYELDFCWALLVMTIDYQNMYELYLCGVCHFSFICVLHKLWSTCLAVECLNMHVSSCQSYQGTGMLCFSSLVTQNSNCINSPCHPLHSSICAPQSTLHQSSNVFRHGKGIHNALPEIPIACSVLTQGHDKN